MRPDLFRLHAELEQHHWWFTARRRIVGELIGDIAPPGAKVIDVGCGTGGNLSGLAEAYECLGIDPAGEAIEEARARFPEVEFIHGLAPEGLGDAAGAGDVFLMMDVLEHVPDDFLLLSELVAAAKPGAHILITVPAEVSLWSEHDVSFGHYRRYDKRRLQWLWAQLPVEVRLLSYYNSRLYPLVKAVRTISRLRNRAGGQAGTDLQMPAAPVNRALERIFAGEFKRLRRLIDRSDLNGFSRGVSLIAILRRLEGTVVPQTAPPGADHGYQGAGAGQT